MFGMPVGTENLNVGLMVEFDSLEQTETYESTDSGLNRRNISEILRSERCKSM